MKNVASIEHITIEASEPPAVNRFAAEALGLTRWRARAFEARAIGFDA